MCGETAETQEIEKIYNQATTDGKGEAIVGGYLVIVTDPIPRPRSQCHRCAPPDNTLSIRLPSGRLLDYADQTTIQVQLVKDKSPVAGMGISVTDRNDNFSSGGPMPPVRLPSPAIPGPPMARQCHRGLGGR